MKRVSDPLSLQESGSTNVYQESRLKTKNGSIAGFHLRSLQRIDSWRLPGSLERSPAAVVAEAEERVSVLRSSRFFALITASSSCRRRLAGSGVKPQRKGVRLARTIHFHPNFLSRVNSELICVCVASLNPRRYGRLCGEYYYRLGSICQEQRAVKKHMLCFEHLAA